MHVSLTVNWCAHIARRKRTHGAKRSINLLQKDTKYIFRPVSVLWSVDLLSDHWSKSKILSTGVRYEGISYSPQKRISQLSDYREWENVQYTVVLGMVLPRGFALQQLKLWFQVSANIQCYSWPLYFKFVNWKVWQQVMKMGSQPSDFKCMYEFSIWEFNSNFCYFFTQQFPPNS